MTPKWLNTNAVIAMNADLVATHGGAGTAIRDYNALESACARAQNLHAYNPNCTLAEMAAAYAVGIAKNHAFVDGNKRTALTAMITFLRLNGSNFVPKHHAQGVQALVMVADGTMTEAELAAFIELNSK